MGGGWSWPRATAGRDVNQELSQPVVAATPLQLQSPGNFPETRDPSHTWESETVEVGPRNQSFKISEAQVQNPLGPEN